MKLTLVVGLLAITTASLAQEPVSLPGQKRSAVSPANANINKQAKTIDTNLVNARDWNKSGQPGPVSANLAANDNKAVVKTSDGKAGTAVANDNIAVAGHGSSRAAGAIDKDGNGVVNAGGKQGTLHRPTNNDANVRAGDQALDTRKDGNNYRTNTTVNGQRAEYNVLSDSQTNTQGTGNLQVQQSGKTENFAYEQKVVGGKRVSSLQNDPNRRGQFIGSNTNKWTCEAEELAPTVCTDENGKISGKAVYNAQGQTTIYDKNNVVIARGDAREIPGGNGQKFEVIVNDGLFKANTEQLKQEDCFDALYAKLPDSLKNPEFKNNKIKIENFKMIWNSKKNPDGSELFSFPDCFKIEYDVVLPQGITYRTLEYQLNMDILPLGTYDCTDAGTCPNVNTNCYYCKLCQKQEAEANNILDNSKGNECENDVSGKRHVVRTICPTPEQSEYILCNGFDRSFLGSRDYFKYEGDIKAEIHFYNLPDRAQLEKEFVQQWSNPIFKLDWTAKYNAAAAQAGKDVFGVGNIFQPGSGKGQPAQEYDYMEFYVQNASKQKRLAGCVKGVADYNLGGEKVSSSQMVDWFSQIGNDNKLAVFKKDKCQQYNKYQKEEYDNFVKSQSGSTSSGTGGGLGGIFGSLGLLGGRGRG